MRRSGGALLVGGAITSFLCLQPAKAAPWPQPEGETLVISRVGVFHGEDGPQDFDQTMTQFYLEHGLTEALTLGGTLGWASQEVTGPFPATANGIVQGDVFLQRRVRRTDNSVTSLRLTYAAGTDLSLRQPDGTTTSSGTDAALEPAVLLGKALDDEGSRFVAAEIGYRASLGSDPDRVKGLFTLGLKPAPSWLATLKLDTSTSLSNGSDPYNDYDVYRLEPSLAYTDGGGRSYEVGLRADIAGRNISTGLAAFIGFWGRF